MYWFWFPHMVVALMLLLHSVEGSETGEDASKLLWKNYAKGLGDRAIPALWKTMAWNETFALHILDPVRRFPMLGEPIDRNTAVYNVANPVPSLHPRWSPNGEVGQAYSDFLAAVLRQAETQTPDKLEEAKQEYASLKAGVANLATIAAATSGLSRESPEYAKQYERYIEEQKKLQKVYAEFRALEFGPLVESAELTKLALEETNQTIMNMPIRRDGATAYVPSYYLADLENAQALIKDGAEEAAVDLQIPLAETEEVSWTTLGFPSSDKLDTFGPFVTFNGKALAGFDNQLIDDEAGAVIQLKAGVFGLLDVVPGLWFQSGVVRKFAGLLAEAEKTRFFGMEGSLTRAAFTVIMAHRPTITLKLSPAAWPRFETLLKLAPAEGTVQFGPLRFRPADLVQRTDANEATITIPDTVAIALVSLPLHPLAVEVPTELSEAIDEPEETETTITSNKPKANKNGAETEKSSLVDKLVVFCSAALAIRVLV